MSKAIRLIGSIGDVLGGVVAGAIAGLQSGWQRDASGTPVYVVSSGETLGGIATAQCGAFGRYMEIWNLQSDEFRASHNNNPNLIRPGDALYMPSDAVARAQNLGILAGTPSGSGTGTVTIPEVVIYGDIDDDDPAPVLNPDQYPKTTPATPATPPSWLQKNWLVTSLGAGAAVLAIAVAKKHGGKSHGAAAAQVAHAKAKHKRNSAMTPKPQMLTQKEVLRDALRARWKYGEGGVTEDAKSPLGYRMPGGKKSLDRLFQEELGYYWKDGHPQVEKVGSRYRLVAA